MALRLVGIITSLVIGLCMLTIAGYYGNYDYVHAHYDVDFYAVFGLFVTGASLVALLDFATRRKL